MPHHLNYDLEKEVNYIPMNKLRIPIKQMHPIEFLKRATSPVKVLKENNKTFTMRKYTLYKNRSVTQNNSERTTLPFRANALKTSLHKNNMLRGLLHAPTKISSMDHQLSVIVPRQMSQSSDWYNEDHLVRETIDHRWEPRLDLSVKF